MRTALALIGIVLLGLVGATQSQEIFSWFERQGKPAMTHEELFQRTVEAFREVSFLGEIPCTIDPDYRYSACFGREEGKGQNELNTLLPKLLEQRGLKLSSIQSGESTSGGTVYAPGLEPYRVGVTINEYEVSLWMSGRLINLGAVESADGKYDVERFAYKSLRDASRDIAMRLLGSAEVSRNQVECQPSSEHAYCVTTKKSARDLLSWFIDTYSPSDRSVMLKGYAKGSFQFSDKTEIMKSLYVSIDFKKSKTVDTYTLWDSDFKRKNFTVTYTPASSKGKNVLRVEASWVDGYTPSPEEK